MDSKMNMENTTMLCPVCKSKLISSGQAKMETLDMHVCNPNAEPPLSNKWVCSNTDCITTNVCFWDFEGEGPFVDAYDEYKKIKFIDGNNAPFGSWWRSMTGADLLRKKITLIKIKKFWMEMTVDYDVNNDGIPGKSHRKIDCYWHDGEYYIMMMGWKMIKFQAKGFIKACKSGKIKDYVDEHTREATGNTEYWRKFGAWWMPKVSFFINKVHQAKNKKNTRTFK